MSTSDMKSKAGAEQTAFVYFAVALFCALFGAIYELFSHEVYSFYMIYAFAFPLAGGTLPFWLLARKTSIRYPGAVVRNLYHSAITTFTVGSLIRGVLEIYGTTNALSGYYFKAGGILLVVAGIKLLYDVSADEV